MNQTLALIVSIVIVLALSRRLGVGVSLFVGSIFLSVSIFGVRGPAVLLTSLVDIYTLRVLLTVFLAFGLGNCMEKAGMLERISESFSRSLGALSLLAIPLLIGLLPMPGGALVSAVMLSKLVKSYNLKAEKATFLNYWYRHIWVTFWPLYPSVIIGSAVLEIDYPTFASATFVIGVAAFFFGLHAMRGMELGVKLRAGDARTLFENFYPVVALVILAAVFKLDLLVALLTSVFLVAVKKRDAIYGLKKAADHRILLLVLAVMGYKGVIEESGVAASFFSDLSFLPTPLAASMLSFVVAFATGIEISYSSIALPLLTGFVGIGSVNAKSLMLVIGSGFVGVMLSPLHLCYVLTAEYFGADIARSYRLLVPPSLATLAVVYLIYLL